MEDVAISKLQSEPCKLFRQSGKVTVICASMLPAIASQVFFMKRVLALIPMEGEHPKSRAKLMSFMRVESSKLSPRVSSTVAVSSASLLSKVRKVSQSYVRSTSCSIDLLNLLLKLLYLIQFLPSLLYYLNRSSSCFKLMISLRYCSSIDSQAMSSCFWCSALSNLTSPWTVVPLT